MRYYFLIFFVLIFSSCIEKRSKKRDIMKSLGNLEEHIRTCPTFITDFFKKRYGDGDVLPYDCGELQVPLFHDKPSVKQLGLQFIYFYPLIGDGKDPVVMTQGGPGGSSIDLLLNSYKSWEKIIARHGLIVFEYRGTDFSDPAMNCKFYYQSQNQVKAHQEMEQCARYWKEKFDISAINSTQVAHDLALLTQKIGFSKFHYYGVSYGTLVGQYLARLHPNRIKSLILDGVLEYGTDWNMADDVFLIALKNMEKNCLEDAYCKEVYGPLDDKLQEAIKSLNKNPIDQYGFTIDGNDFGQFIHSSLYSYVTAPLAYRLISKWENNSLIEQNVSPKFSNEINVVYWTVYCTERKLSEQKKHQENDMNDYLDDNCGHWLSEGASPQWLELSEEAKNIPTLLLSGEYDPVTPSTYADAVKEPFNHAKHVLVKGHAHGVFFESACVGELVFKFLKNPSSEFKHSCDKPSDFLPKYVAADANLLTPSASSIILEGWEESEQYLLKEEDKLSFIQHRFIGDPDEIYWMMRKDQGGASKPLTKSEVTVNERNWQLIGSFFDEEKTKHLTMAFIPCDNSWFSMVYLGKQEGQSVEALSQILSSLNDNTSLCFVEKPSDT